MANKEKERKNNALNNAELTNTHSCMSWHFQKKEKKGNVVNKKVIH